ncbi:MAG TPA: hypothetical protein DCZ49_05445 [Hyphomonadaceae bacterium]|nr:hypothetical protein [Hyphomonadaceae bacterium]
MRFSRKLLMTGLLASTVFSAPVVTLAQAQENSPVDTAPRGLAPQQEQQPTGGPQNEEAELRQSEVAVRGRFIPDVKRTTSEIVSIVTTEDFDLAGDSDISEALRRLPGLSVVGDGFVFVRGLGDRYSAATLDGAILPSPEVLRRVVPLSLIPTALLESSTVQKTYSADLPGQFAGGLVQLTTRAVPDEAYFTASASTAFNTFSTFTNGLGFDAGRNEFLGIHSGRLDLPTLIANDPDLNFIGQVPTEIELAGEALVANGASLEFEENAPDVDLTLSGGIPFKLFGFKAGVLAAIDYDADFRNEFGVDNRFAVAGGVPTFQEIADPDVCAGLIQFDNVAGFDPEDCGLFRTDFTVSLNSIGSFGIEFSDDHEVKYVTTVLRRTTRQAQLRVGTRDGADDILQSESLRNFVEQQLWTNLIAGSHKFGGENNTGLNAKWRLAYARAERETPQVVESVFQATAATNVFQLTDFSNDFNITFTGLADDNFEAGFDLDYYTQIFGREISFKTGFQYVNRDREFATRIFNFSAVDPSRISPTLNQFVPEIIFSPDNIGPGGFVLGEIAPPSQNFDAGLEVFAAYLSIEAQVFRDLRITAGVRYEDSAQTSNTSDFFGNPVDVLQQETFLLPAVTATWEFADNQQLRFAFSETISRPDLRELASAVFLDETTGFFQQGNPDLEITQIRNFDARYEWYFLPRQIFSAAFFYKTFDQPIEFAVGGIGEGLLQLFTNAEEADLIGAEVELEFNVPVEKLFNTGFTNARRFFVVANATFVDTSVNILDGGAITNANRPLFGQSRWLGNFQIGWQKTDKTERVNFAFNYTGDRIFAAGTATLPDVIENPPLILDFVAAKTFNILNRAIEFEFKAENLLGEGFRISQAGQVSQDFRNGTLFTLGATVKF